jgi:hypothetical protein
MLHRKMEKTRKSQRKADAKMLNINAFCIQQQKGFRYKIEVTNGPDRTKVLSPGLR